MVRLTSLDPLPVPMTIAASAYQAAPGCNVGNVVKRSQAHIGPDRTMETGVIRIPKDQR
jgi:hypothetical protein